MLPFLLNGTASHPPAAQQKAGNALLVPMNNHQVHYCVLYLPHSSIPLRKPPPAQFLDRIHLVYILRGPCTRLSPIYNILHD